MSEEYSVLTPNTLEAQGLTNNTEYQKYYNLSCSPETHHKLTGFIALTKIYNGPYSRRIPDQSQRYG